MSLAEAHQRLANGNYFGSVMVALGHADALYDDDVLSVILPEFIPSKWWQHLLHNQTALLIKGAMLFRKRVIVADVPYHLT